MLTRCTPTSSRKRSMKRSYSAIVYASEPGFPERPNPGRSGARPPPRARNGNQSSEFVGTPWRYSGTVPAVVSALRQKIGRPSSSPLWSLHSGTGEARIYAPRRPDTVEGVSLPAVDDGPGARAPAAARAWRPPSRARVVRVRERLREVFGVPLMRPHRHPLAELVLTVLSQSTNDRNRDVAYLRLRERLPSWEAVRDVPVAEVEEAIRPGGISKVKSQRIQAILRAISADPRDPAHELSLDWMADAALDESRDYLIRLPGVGRKTAACVLLFSYGLHEVPVDTHVSRVGTR